MTGIPEGCDAGRREARIRSVEKKAGVDSWALGHISSYLGTSIPITRDAGRTQHKLLMERVQTGLRMEKRLLKVQKAFAEYHDMTLGDLLEGIVLHAFDGKCPFEAGSLRRIRELKEFYGLNLDSRASHRLREVRAVDSTRKRRKS